jgi:ribosome recycling factor
MEGNMVKDILREAELRMKGSVTALESDLQTFRTGVASPHLLDRIEVEMYGTLMPLNQLAVIAAPEPQQLSIRPYDPNSISAIERAILKSDLGLTPNNDGAIVRLNLPRLTEERRRELSRLVSKRVEEARVSVRNVRRDTLNDLRDLKEEKEISENQFYISQDDLQKLTDNYIAQIDDLGEKKEAEIMEV